MKPAMRHKKEPDELHAEAPNLIGPTCSTSEEGIHLTKNPGHKIHKTNQQEILPNANLSIKVEIDTKTDEPSVIVDSPQIYPTMDEMQTKDVHIDSPVAINVAQEIVIPNAEFEKSVASPFAETEPLADIFEVPAKDNDTMPGFDSDKIFRSPRRPNSISRKSQSLRRTSEIDLEKTAHAGEQMKRPMELQRRLSKTTREGSPRMSSHAPTAELAALGTGNVAALKRALTKTSTETKIEKPKEVAMTEKISLQDRMKMFQNNQPQIIRPERAGSGR